MQFKISTGQTKDIVIGSMVVVQDGYLPPEFTKEMIEIVDIKDGYPMAQLEDDQLSCIDPAIIAKVYN